MKAKHSYSFIRPTLLVLGVLLLWGAVSTKVRTANTISFFCEELEECFENELEAGPRKFFSTGSSHNAFVIKNETVCFMQFLCTTKSSNTDGASGWLMPLRI